MTNVAGLGGYKVTLTQKEVWHLLTSGILTRATEVCNQAPREQNECGPESKAQSPRFVAS